MADTFGGKFANVKASAINDKNAAHGATIWSTEKIDRMLEEYHEGLRDIKGTKNSPFFSNDIQSRRANITFEYTQDELEEIRKCAQDVKYFVRKYVYVMTDDGRIKIEHLRDYQDEILDAFVKYDRNILMASRQIGKTVTAAMFIVWYLIFNIDKNALIVADIADTTKEVIDKVKEIINFLPFFLKPGIKVNNVNSMKFDNGSRIIGRSTTKKTGIGFSINLLYMDEFAHINDSYLKYFYRSVYPTVESFKDSKIIITSTPNGINRFHDLWVSALEGTSSYHPMRVDYWQLPNRDEDWKNRTIADLGSVEDFKQEYGLQFYASDDLILDSVDLQKIYSIKTKFEQKNTESLFIDGRNYSKFLEFHPDFLAKTFTGDLGDMRGDKNKYVFSIDTSDGIGRDYSVLNIFKLAALPLYYLFKNRFSVTKEYDIFSLIQVGKFRTNTININEFANVCNAIIFRLFNPDNVKIVLEMNHKGETILERLKQNGDFYTGMIIYSKHTDLAKTFEPGIKIGSSKKKKAYCDKFKFHLSVDRIIPTEYNTIYELGSLGRAKDGIAIRSQLGKDDLAMTAINASAFFDSPQFWELCEAEYDEMKDLDYKNTVEKEIIQFNRELQNTDLAQFKSMLSELNMSS